MGSMVLVYMVTFTINIPQMLAYIYIPYMDPMGNHSNLRIWCLESLFQAKPFGDPTETLA